MTMTAIEVGHEPVENQHGVVIARCEKDCVPACRAMIDDVAGGTKQSLDVVAHFLIVFEQENFHHGLPNS